jgi:hypothetical protein
MCHALPLRSRPMSPGGVSESGAKKTRTSRALKTFMFWMWQDGAKVVSLAPAVAKMDWRSAADMTSVRPQNRASSETDAVAC